MEKVETAVLLQHYYQPAVAVIVSLGVGCRKFRQTVNDGHFVVFSQMRILVWNVAYGTVRYVYVIVEIAQA